MISSDPSATHPSNEGVSVNAEATGAELAESSPGGIDGNDAVLEKRVSLPKPDINNITVLTESLPNDPILPWHHFDSPWLEKEETATEEHPTEAVSPPTHDDYSEQLSLALESDSLEISTDQKAAENSVPDHQYSDHQPPAESSHLEDTARH